MIAKHVYSIMLSLKSFNMKFDLFINILYFIVYMLNLLTLLVRVMQLVMRMNVYLIYSRKKISRKLVKAEENNNSV